MGHPPPGARAAPASSAAGMERESDIGALRLVSPTPTGAQPGSGRNLADRTDLEYAMLDGSIVKVRRAGQGAEGGLNARP